MDNRDEDDETREEILSLDEVDGIRFFGGADCGIEDKG